MGRNKNTKATIRSKLPPNGSRNRRIGHDYERALVKEFKDLGYKSCSTSRYSSRALDDAKIDINLPDLNVQAKNVRGNIDYMDVFQQMNDELKRILPERHDLNLISTIFHKKNGKQFVVLTKQDFYKIWRFLKRHDLIKDL
jgi:hypothetical protein